MSETNPHLVTLEFGRRFCEEFQPMASINTLEAFNEVISQAKKFCCRFQRQGDSLVCENVIVDFSHLTEKMPIYEASLLKTHLDEWCRLREFIAELEKISAMWPYTREKHSVTHSKLTSGSTVIIVETKYL